MRDVQQVFGELCLTFGVVMLLFVGYLVWGTTIRASHAQQAFRSELNGQWRSSARQAPAARPLPDHVHLVFGQPFAFLEIPHFGKHWRFAIVQGTSLPQLALGPGHVPGAALPGDMGNFAVAGHRVTAGNPFYHLPSLAPGDRVIVETRVNRYDYRVTRVRRVLPSDVSVLAPVPGHPHQHPKQRLITLITCDPPWTGTHRIVVSGDLVHARPRLGRVG